MMRKSTNSKNKPTIFVYYSSEIKDISIFNQLLWGIEEEGIPFDVIEKSNGTALELSYLAAEDSSLNAGIGIGEDGFIVLHYAKLSIDKPLFTISQESNSKLQRALGANAARLVKGIPFKSLTNDHKLEKDAIENKELKTIISQVIEKLIQAGALGR
ncbi:MAG: glycerol dehydratase reactivase beta/small subunit family protein [Thermotaleaceae bacterium]